MSPFSSRVLPLILSANAVLAASMTTAALADDGPEPDICVSKIWPSGYFLGEWFYNVPMLLQSNPGGGNIGNYVHDMDFNDPISIADENDTYWAWQNASATFSCWKQYQFLWTVHYVTVIPPAGGSLYPVGSDGCGDATLRSSETARSPDAGFEANIGGLSDDCGDTGQSGGGTGSNGGDGSGSCTTSYGDILISNDNGSSWSLLYEGWYTECDDGTLYFD